jgi:hypothetical protein
VKRSVLCGGTFSFSLHPYSGKLLKLIDFNKLECILEINTINRQRTTLQRSHCSNISRKLDLISVPFGRQ